MALLIEMYYDDHGCIVKHSGFVSYAVSNSYVAEDHYGKMDYKSLANEWVNHIMNCHVGEAIEVVFNPAFVVMVIEELAANRAEGLKDTLDDRHSRTTGPVVSD